MKQAPGNITNKNNTSTQGAQNINKPFLTYWDYINIDTLLDLQQPLTDYPDEKVFITYHQISELYFKMMLQEIQLLVDHNAIDRQYFLSRVERLNRYAEQLASSMEIMTDGLDHQQFLKFRKELYPASGFQSAQFRKIELNTTTLDCLLAFSLREHLPENTTDEELFEQIYWKKGATEKGSGEKSITLVQFEEKYNDELIKEYKDAKYKNVYHIYNSKYSAFGDAKIIEAMKEFDFLINIRWRLSHFKSASKHLASDPLEADKESTGGTNWKEFLPPRFQKNIFFPSLWSEQEKDEWGKRWVVDLFQ